MGAQSSRDTEDAAPEEELSPERSLVHFDVFSVKTSHLQVKSEHLIKRADRQDRCRQTGVH